MSKDDDEDVCREANQKEREGTSVNLLCCLVFQQGALDSSSDRFELDDCSDFGASGSRSFKHLNKNISMMVDVKRIHTVWFKVSFTL